jgi:hypothetical protein
MVVKKTSKRNAKRNTKYKLRHSKKTKKNKSVRRYMNMNRNNKSKSRNNKKNKNQKGGFGCGPIASVKEPGFEVPALSSVSGLSIPDMRATIYRPDCKIDTYQAMVPK